jgi:nicotinate-nucleotide pyrophosphorylase (carboxylating)
MVRPAMDEATLANGLTLFEMALVEDLGVADLDKGVCGTTDAVVPAGVQAQAKLVSREAGVVCGLALCVAAIEKWAPAVDLECVLADGDEVAVGQTLAVLSGDAHQILVVERTCLNFLCRLSAISSLTRKYVEQVSGSEARVLDTRKTAPGWRRLEKYAVACGGGANHRMGLYDAVMLKDNHLAFMRSEVENKEEAIPLAIAKARSWIAEHAATLPFGRETVLQIEVDTLEQLSRALSSSPDIVLLDNMSNEQLTQSVRMRDSTAPEVLLEASGGVTLETIGEIAAPGVERISVGAMTHSAGNFDIGLDWSL